MTFCSKEQNENEVISEVTENNYGYSVTYMDGTNINYYNNIDVLEKKVIDQAIERDKLEYVSVNIKKYGDLYTWLLSTAVSCTCLLNEKLFLALCFAVVSYIFCDKFIYNRYKLKELKKYRILLDNYNKIKENQDLYEIVEFDSYYRIPIDIFNIDNISLHDMKLIKRELKRRNV